MIWPMYPMVGLGTGEDPSANATGAFLFEHFDYPEKEKGRS